MTRIVQVTTVQETRLWKILSESDGQDAKFLSASIPRLCEEAVDRMKAMYRYASQYTLHDDRHLLRTTELMGLVLGSEAERLNIIELALLILSAFFHDQGMVLSEQEFSSLEGDTDFQLFRDNWRIEHPNYRETAAQLNSPLCADARKAQLAGQLTELDTAMLTDYIRETHGNRTGEFIRSVYGNDKRLEMQSVNLAPFLASLCESHVLPSDGLISRTGFRYDEQIGTFIVNLPFLATVLRLSDILDFDRDRTPEVLLKSIHFTSPVSLLEWEKHRSVEGWQISQDRIRFSIKCEHPAYEAAARRYMDWIDNELAASKEIFRLQPREIEGYELKLPTHVDRSRIEPLNDAYRFHDLEFTLSTDEVVRLVMTDKLYGQTHLCIRELLQNSLDALRYRKALFSDAGVQWNDGTVELRHYVDEDGYEVLECSDNGAGMDEEIIKNHFVKVGRSFYRSPFFERERTRLKASGNDFDPCSQFGIGFMSCFMLGDRITIKTRRDYGHGRQWGAPLVVEVRGLSGLLVVREGAPEQSIGTTVSIISRQKPSFLDRWTDKVELCPVLKGYALATEFPIVGICDVPELKEQVSIPAKPEIIPTTLEKARVGNRESFHQDLSQVSAFLGGFVRESVLIDDVGVPCLANTEAEWRGKIEGGSKEWGLYLLPTNSELESDFREWNSVPVCMDGILVSGPPGRPSYGMELRLRLGSSNSRIHSHSPALIDARGSLKPEITPGRVPAYHLGGTDLPPGWMRLSDAFDQGLGLLWAQLADCIRRGLTPETFWKLTTVHGVPVGWIPCGTLWEILSVSCTKNGCQTRWSLVRDLGEMSICHTDKQSFLLEDQQGWRVGPDLDLLAWEGEGGRRPQLDWIMNSVALLMSCLDVRDGTVILSPAPPVQPQIPLAQYAEYSRFGVNMVLVDYVGNARDVLSVQTPLPTANRIHPLAELYHQSRYVSEPTDLQDFARSFVPCISSTVSTKEQTPSFSEVSYWQKRVGHLYLSVQWDQYNASLRPPYRLWTEDRGWFSFSEEDFAHWREASVDDG
ncbi:MAG: ATP-binding protein [Desulfomonile tiedjei]|nr:ATP-binding protein [Desulfomonile tiedjei]